MRDDHALPPPCTQSGRRARLTGDRFSGPSLGRAGHRPSLLFPFTHPRRPAAPPSRSLDRLSPAWDWAVTSPEPPGRDSERSWDDLPVTAAASSLVTTDGCCV